MTDPNISRRKLLKGMGVTMALPFMESMAGPKVNSEPPRRMVCICNNLGLHLPNFVPDGEGRGYKASRYLKHIDDLRNKFTVFSGVSHPSVDGGHSAEKSFLTTAPHPGGGSFKNSISLDQLSATHVG